MSTRHVRIAAMVAAVTFAASCSSVQNPEVPPSTPAFPDTNLPVAETLDGRLVQAQAAALGRGADVSIAVLDRSTHSYVDVAGDQQIETASVAKLFIAEELFHLDARGERPITDDDRTLMTAMLESSDDSAANVLWDAVGGPDVVTRVAERFALTETEPPWDGLWWNTETTTRDLVTFYDAVLDDRDQLGPERVAQFVDYLRRSTAQGADGYDQRFGLPDALFDEPVIGVKQGWMCCVDGQWIHLSTGIIGEDNRYVIAIGSREDVQYQDDDSFYPDTSLVDAVDDESALHARDTVTGVTQILFPGGSVDDWAVVTKNNAALPEASGP